MHEETTAPSKKITKQFLLFTLAIILFACLLRAPLTMVGPIINILQEKLHISATLGGFLTTIPLLAFGAISPIAPKVARKLSIEKTLFLSIFLLVIGILLRSFGNVSMLIFGTVLIGVAIAFGNVLIPSFFKLQFPLQIGLLMGIYTVAMNLSAGIGSGLSYPLASSAIGWQGALAVTAILSIFTIIIWLPILKGRKVALATANKSQAKKMSKIPLAWAVAFTMGLQSFLYYCIAAWIPEIFMAQGVSQSTAGWLILVFQISQIPMTFIVPIIADKLKSQRPIVIFYTCCYLIAFTGIIMEWSYLAMLWMILLGCAGGASFSFCMMLFTLRTKTAYEAADLSGFGQSIGYTLAAIGPVLFGFIQSVSSSWFIPNLLFIVVAIFLFLVAMVSSKSAYV